MPNEVLVKVGTQHIFFVTGSYSPVDAATDFQISGATEHVLTLSAVANAAGRQSTKADLTATRPRAFECMAAFDFTGETPTAGQTVDVYWAPSTSATQANGNVAGNSGGDGAAPDGALGSITLAEFILQCDFVGSLVCHDGAVVQNGLINSRFEPSSRYGQIVVVNNSGDAFEADSVEMAVVLTGIVDEVQ